VLVYLINLTIQTRRNRPIFVHHNSEQRNKIYKKKKLFAINMSVPSAPHQRAAIKNRDPCPSQKKFRYFLPGATYGGALLLLLISIGLDLGSVHCYGEYQRPTTCPYIVWLFNSIRFICIYMIRAYRERFA